MIPKLQDHQTKISLTTAVWFVLSHYILFCSNEQNNPYLLQKIHTQKTSAKQKVLIIC
ncbi:hypothetical protein HMPREF1565_1373 [Providencia alcalifaciens RIMD 1656011]|uniref:Uncharacterized protein n=2 Tax=Providencia alcalifaciens TaxID=126385 RepID=B6XJ12_9GAMM|nr:hypothetical protein PROVALCAL_03361 [Providencia alcalifaciens DSM 30120]ETT08124.1 hypothetical protein HMPREF1562_0447 [Providencia alcalifaciens F90-2004]EUC95520.1 hypothetical protein HMPREF1567_3690 [Providencia alcalifaciens PAL-2]EUD02252.1 hypothetical protein HMPREF1565_1373 [Providencia alcalifaciens RIMD 1656011]EUD07749.1 hypothetical protein HMPREF1564_1367 [Providencia alcalifaciens R90-1475]EUD10248.1 hypothetical protein HMPREF1563_0073 [Providencia alcalifaciens 205/92]S